MIFKCMKKLTRRVKVQMNLHYFLCQPFKSKNYITGLNDFFQRKKGKRPEKSIYLTPEISLTQRGRGESSKTIPNTKQKVVTMNVRIYLCGAKQVTLYAEKK